MMVHFERQYLLMGGWHAECVVQEHLDCSHDHSRVGVAEPVIQNVHEVIHFLLIRGPVVGGELKNLALSPF